MRGEFFHGYPSGFVTYSLGNHCTQFHAVICPVTVIYLSDLTKRGVIILRWQYFKVVDVIGVKSIIFYQNGD